MFQGLTQGATIFVLYKNEPKVVDGKILSVNTHMPTYNPHQPMAMMNGPVTDISVQVGNETIPFAGLPANGIVANFPDKGLFISTEHSAIVREVESLANTSRQVIESVPAHEKILSSCESLLLELNPERKKEAQQAKELSTLKDELAEMKKLLLAMSEKQQTEK